MMAQSGLSCLLEADLEGAITSQSIHLSSHFAISLVFKFVNSSTGQVEVAVLFQSNPLVSLIHGGRYLIPPVDASLGSSDDGEKSKSNWQGRAVKVFVSHTRCVAPLSVAELLRKTPSQTISINMFWPDLIRSAEIKIVWRADQWTVYFKGDRGWQDTWGLTAL